MRKMLMVGGVAALLLGASACTPSQIAAAKRAARHHAPVTTTTVPWVEECLETGGPGVVRFRLTETIDCDIVPPDTLTLTVDQRDWAVHTGSTDGWGGDGSLEWATQALEDAGCTVTWMNPIQGVGAGCDY